MTTLSGEDWGAVRALFDALLPLPATERARRLAREPGAIADQVGSLLASSGGGGILDRAPPGLVAEGEAAPGSLAEGARVGAFTVDRLIGRGGMGEVYLAHRATADFRQQVALKLLRIEAADRRDLFDRERRTLAGLEHRGIARLIDGGIAPDGRPFMALDYVDGVGIDVWCRDHAASLETRLALFLEVCDAVSYAHANLVVHRDLKPSNILIDKSGAVRLLDFGIARLIDEIPDGAVTAAVMTPDYAAPEQLGGGTSTVATDIYALGAVLYELLTGSSPWRRDGASIPAIVRRVLHEDPPLASRAASPPVPASRIAGDLDAIMLKAMRRPPADRYASVAALADDVRRHLAHQPVAARAGSTRYRGGRFLRRNRWAVAGAAALLLALVVGAAGIAWQARQTAIERDVALAQARRSDAINRMLTLMFRDAQESGLGEDATVKAVLDDTARRLVASVDTSAASATLIATIADLYMNVEDPAGADALLQAALAKGVGRGDPVATAGLKLRLAATAASMNRNDEIAPLLDAAEPVFRADPERYPTEIVEVVSSRAQLAKRQGDYPRAIALMTGNLDRADRAYAGTPRDLLVIYNNLLVYMLEANRADEMAPVFARAEGIVRRMGQADTNVGLSILQLRGVWLTKQGDAAGAERIFAEVIQRRRATFGKSASLAVDLYQLGRVKLMAGKYPEAVTLLAEAAPLAREHLGAAALPTVITALALAEAQAETGDAAAATVGLAAQAGAVAKLGVGGPVDAVATKVRAIVALKRGDRATARAEATKAEAMFAKAGAMGQAYMKGMAALKARIG